MTTRILPRAEWAKLAGTELAEVWPLLHADAQVYVVEEDGQTIGCWCLFPVWHAEGVWIAPAHRGRGAVARRLLRGLREMSQRVGARSVMTGCLGEPVRTLLSHLRAVPVPDQFVFPVEASECQQ